MPRVLPREGLTQEILVAPFRLTLLQPALTGVLLLGLHRYPQVLASIFPANVFRKLLAPRTTTIVYILFALGLLRKVSNGLSRLMLNNFQRDKSWDWSKEVVLITGGSGGIGALIVKLLAEKNITVVILDVTAPNFQAQFPTVHFYQTDITSSEQIYVVAEKIRAEHGEPTVLINNAGVGMNRTILDETESDVRRVFDVNTISHFLLAKEFCPAMIKSNHGHVVTVASLATFMVHAGNVDYACTKASALAFHEGLAQEFKSRYNANKVRTTIVHPTWIRTPLTAKLLAKKDFAEFVLEPETVAEAVVKQILSGCSGQLILPGRYNLVPLIRGLPSWLQEGMRNGVAQVLNTSA